MVDGRDELTGYEIAHGDQKADAQKLGNVNVSQAAMSVIFVRLDRIDNRLTAIEDALIALVSGKRVARNTMGVMAVDEEIGGK